MEVERLQSLCEEPLVGYHLESVVGIRHATGAKGVRPGDTLSLAREPNNLYDACAVRVDREGEKVGYVRGAFAKRLAVVMDNAMDKTMDQEEGERTLHGPRHARRVRREGCPGVLHPRSVPRLERHPAGGEQLDTGSKQGGSVLSSVLPRPSNHTKKPLRRTKRPTGTTFHSSRPFALPWKPARRSTKRSGDKVP